MSRPTRAAINRRHLLGVAGAGALSMLDGVGRGGATPPGHRSAMAIIPERLGLTPEMQLSAEQQADLDAVVVDTTDAIQLFAASLTDFQRQQLLFPLESVVRTRGRDATLTPAFCAVLLWCVPGWGLTLGSLSFEQRTAFEAFLATALGPTGYDTVSGVRNRQILIGVLEDSASTEAVAAAARFAPGRTFDDLAALVTAVQAGGAALPPEAIVAASIGGMNPGTEDWIWPPPGLAERSNQFGDYAIAIFGKPGEETWAMRLEGHHLSVNLTFVKVDGHWQVHGAPLFTGIFPVLVPPPVGRADLTNPLAWLQGQTRGLSLIRNIRKFWNAVPERQRSAARRPPEAFKQLPPLVNETPGPMFVSLDIEPDADRIGQGPHMDINAATLSAEARRPLAALCDELVSTLHPAVAAPYRRRLDEAARSSRIVATWAGGDLGDAGSQHFTSIAIGTFLVELLQSPQYSVSSPQLPWSNHLHVMFRDLESPAWGNPLGAHVQNHHPPA